MPHIRPAVALALLLVVVMAASCGLLATKIGDIRANPGKYEGKSVTVSGTVTSSVNVLFVKGYNINDGTGTILVVPKGAVPAEGAKVKISGKIQQLVAIGSASMVVLNQE